MSRTIPALMQDEFDKRAYTPFFLWRFTDGTYDYFYTECDVPLVYSGDRYEPRAIKVPRIKQSLTQMSSDCSIQVDNVDLVLSTPFLTNDIKLQETKLYLTVLDSDYHIIETVLIFDGIIDSYKMDDNLIKIKILGEVSIWKLQSIPEVCMSCPWRLFKGTECGYIGSETSCDRTYANCLSLSNADNFGGQRWMRSVSEAKITWGDE